MAVSGRKAEEVKLETGAIDVHCCGPCEIDAEHVDAYGYCLDCTDYLCKVCFKSHSKSRASRHNKLLTCDELSFSDKGQLTGTKTCNDRCETHKERIKFYCDVHKTLGCSDCITLEHKTCHPQYIPNESKEFHDSVEYYTTECDLENELEELQTIKKKITVIEDIIEKMHKQCLRDIDCFTKQMIGKVIRSQEEMKVIAAYNKKKIEKDVDSVKSSVQKMMSELKQVVIDLQRQKNAKQNEKLFIGTKRAQDDLMSHKRKARELSILEGEVMYHFQRGQGLEKVLAEPNAFGKLRTPERFEELEPVSNGVVVLGVPEDITTDDVKAYFEDETVSDGGETVDFDVHTSDSCCTVVFKDPKVTERVCQKKDHNLSGHQVEVLTYSEYLDPFDASIILDTALDKIRYFKPLNISKLPFSLGKDLSSCYAQILWHEDPIRVQCTVGKGDRRRRNLLRSWKEEAHQVLQQFDEKLCVKVMTFSDANWRDVKDELMSVTIADNTTIAVSIASNKYQVQLFCFEGYKESDLKVIEDKLKDLTNLKRNENRPLTETFKKEQIVQFPKYLMCYRL